MHVVSTASMVCWVCGVSRSGRYAALRRASQFRLVRSRNESGTRGDWRGWRTSHKAGMLRKSRKAGNSRKRHRVCWRRQREQHRLAILLQGRLAASDRPQDPARVILASAQADDRLVGLVEEDRNTLRLADHGGDQVGVSANVEFALSVLVAERQGVIRSRRLPLAHGLEAVDDFVNGIESMDVGVFAQMLPTRCVSLWRSPSA